MWSSYLLTLYRAMTRHRLYAALNILGLALGVAVCLVLALSARFEASFDRWVPHASSIYRVNQTLTTQGALGLPRPGTPGVVLAALLKDYPREIAAGTRIQAESVTVSSGPRPVSADLKFVDATFFQVFELPLVSGTPAALEDLSSLYVSETFARETLKDSTPLGRRVILIIQGRPHTYRVAGVLKDLPNNSSIKIELLARYDASFYFGERRRQLFEQWSSSSAQTWLRIENPDDARRIGSELTRFVERNIRDHPADSMKLTLTALPDVHFFDGRWGVPSESPGADPLLVTAMAAVAAMTLLIAVINYVNLATARAALRAREVAVRKALGATRRELMIQFLAEAVATTAIAALLGLLIAQVALPLVGDWLGAPGYIPYLGKDGVLPWFIGLTLLVGVAAGAYPALILSRFDPAPVLAASQLPGGGRMGARIREALVVVQFTAAIALAVCAGVVAAQTDYLRRADAGYVRSGLLVVPAYLDPALEAVRPALLDAFRRTPGVVAATHSSRAPAGVNTMSMSTRGIGPGGGRLLFVYETVGADYARTLRPRLLAGRFVGADEARDDIAGLGLDVDGRNVVINDVALRMLRYRSPQSAIGKTMRFGRANVTIVGVVEGMRFSSPQEPVEPVAYFYSSGDVEVPIAIVRFEGVEPKVMIRRLEKAWRSVAPGAPFEAKTADESMAPFYERNDSRGRLFAVGSGLALAIGAVGLYGLAAFTAARRTREIGIRKAFGASTLDVLRLLLLQFLRPVAISIVFAWPIAYLVMTAWLSQFDQRVALSPSHFIAAALAAIVIALVTILRQALRLAQRDSIKALRSE